MSETSQPPGSTIDNPILNEDVGADEVLQALVATLDDSDRGSVTMTLGVNGCLVTGTVVGERRWFLDLEMAHAELREGFTTPLRRRMVDEREGETTETDPVEVRFVHMKDARYLTGAGFVPNERATGLFWRARLAHVSSWSFGVIGPHQQ